MSLSQSEEYSRYWNLHAQNVGHRLAVTDLSPEHYDRHFNQLFDEIAPERVHRMLDYGCGAGLLVPLVRDRWPSAVYEGADISVELINFCKAMYPGICFYHLPDHPPQGQYDFITCHSIFTHTTIEDTEKILDQFYLLLTDEGVASVSILTITDQDYSGSVPARIDISREFFRGLLEKHGFKILKTVDRYQWYTLIEKAHVA